MQLRLERYKNIDNENVTPKFELSETLSPPFDGG
jgi:hypothetical protein